jgi:pilus assembly protein CpaB
MLRIFVLMIALGAGGLAAWVALSMKSGDAAPLPVAAPAPKEAMEEVLVASADLGQGQSLDDAKLRWQAWPKAAVPSGSISRTAKPDATTELKGAIVRSYFVSGEPIREEKLTRASSGLLAALLPSGKRAIAIRVSAESTAGGFILPNDRVDVIQTMARQAATQTENLSRTLLSNIRVLAVDQKADEAKADAAVVGKTVTLELSPAQAEIVASGQATGALSLALRSVADVDEAPVHRLEVNNAVRILRAGRSEVVRVQ